jgi:hypothetical protein
MFMLAERLARAAAGTAPEVDLRPAEGEVLARGRRP